MPEYLYVTPRGPALPFFMEYEPAADVMRDPGKEIKGWHVDRKGRRQDRVEPPVVRAECWRIERALLHEQAGLVVV